MKSRPAFEHTRSCLSCQSASCFSPHDAKKPGWDQHMPVWGPHQHNIQHWRNRGCPWVSACPPSQHPQGAQGHPGTGQTNLPGKQADGWEARGALPAQLVPPPGSCSAFSNSSISPPSRSGFRCPSAPRTHSRFLRQAWGLWALQRTAPLPRNGDCQQMFGGNMWSLILGALGRARDEAASQCPPSLAATSPL